MVPTVADPPAVPFTDQVTAVFAFPVTVVAKDWVAPSTTLAVAGVTATTTGGVVRVMVDWAKTVGSAAEVARTVTVAGEGRTAGAV